MEDETVLREFEDWYCEWKPPEGAFRHDQEIALKTFAKHAWFQSSVATASRIALKFGL